MSVSVQDMLKRKELTYLELPPDVQKLTKKPNSDVISDKDRVAATRSPQLDPKELKKLMASPHPGTPGPSGPQVQQPSPPAVENNAGQQTPQQGPPTQQPQSQSQVAQLRPPVQPAPQIKFGTSMSAGSRIDQAARAAVQNRGGFGGDGGDYGLNQGARAGAQSQLEVLTDTMGVDFNPYLQRVLHDVKENWYNLIPESVDFKKGRVVIQFFIMKDGRVLGLETVSSSGDAALDRPAFGSITASNPFPPLPKEFPGPYLGLRFSYYYNLNTDGSEIH
jgi:TonB family protein